jgi:heme-degrading monooxygenase HmoA
MLYARLQTVRGMPGPEEAGPVERELMEIVARHPGFAGLCLMAAVEDTEAGALLTLWRTLEDARLAADRTARARPGPRPVTLESDRIYEVQGQYEGPDAGLPAAAAVLLFFDGPCDDEWLESARFAHRERIGPALTASPGFIRGFALWDPRDRVGAVVNLAVSLEALARAERAVNSTELLPGENPALLTGPDRAIVHRVSGYVGAPS